ncbi:hypothetical protein OBBRIDRAFT_837181 [Obba rivulosa]|uniref:Uncharacterized protein n=1 Tax=Obba rivulosa TaxID=1052685 RepID=A0A8E2AN33_9APHY|nr:hypothetical protein OBBRIDRAFT_837181 [Obba rivulosa]
MLLKKARLAEDLAKERMRGTTPMYWGATAGPNGSGHREVGLHARMFGRWICRGRPGTLDSDPGREQVRGTETLDGRRAQCTGKGVCEQVKLRAHAGTTEAAGAGGQPAEGLQAGEIWRDGELGTVRRSANGRTGAGRTGGWGMGGSGEAVRRRAARASGEQRVQRRTCTRRSRVMSWAAAGSCVTDRDGDELSNGGADRGGRREIGSGARVDGVSACGPGDEQSRQTLCPRRSPLAPLAPRPADVRSATAMDDDAPPFVHAQLPVHSHYDRDRL